MKSPEACLVKPQGGLPAGVASAPSAAAPAGGPSQGGGTLAGASSASLGRPSVQVLVSSWVWGRGMDVGPTDMGPTGAERCLARLPVG